MFYVYILIKSMVLRHYGSVIYDVLSISVLSLLLYWKTIKIYCILNLRNS